MKKIGVFLTVLFMGLVFTVRSPVKADSLAIPFGWVQDLVELADMLFSGAEIDINLWVQQSNTLGGLIDGLRQYKEDNNIVSNISSNQDWAIKLGLNNLALNGVTELTADDVLNIPMLPSDLAAFMSYNPDWVVNYGIPNEIIIDSNADNFATQIHSLNTRYPLTTPYYANYGYWWHNLPAGFVNGFVPSGNSISFAGDWNNSGYFISDPANRSTYTSLMACFDILDLNIISSSPNVYNFSITLNPADAIPYGSINNVPVKWFSIGYIGLSDMYTMSSYENNISSKTYSYSGSLNDVFNYIANHFRNVNVYVDGSLYAWCGEIASNPVNMANVVSVGDLDSSTYNTFPIDEPGDIGLNLAAFGAWLENMIINGDGTISIDDVITDGDTLISTDEGDRAVTDDDAEDVAKVIAGYGYNPNSTPTPTPDIGDPPVLKIIPPILDLPDEIWPDGGRDTTVLAQIIHATDVAMPNDMMTVIWSIIGILVVGGLISILHK